MNDLKNDIERYLQGELTPSEMHALEKRALSDPFLADALEGAQELKEDLFENDVHDLQKLIDQRTDQSKKIIPLWGWTLRIAAGLALIAAFTFVILNIIKDPKPVQLAENKIKSEVKPAEEKGITQLSDTIEQPKEATQGSKSKPKALQPRSVITTPLEKPSAVASQQVLAEAEVPATEKEKITQSEESKEVQVAANPTEVSVQSPAKKMDVKDDDAKVSRSKTAGAPAEFSIADDPSAPNIIRTVKGHVSSLEDGSALPGVNVLIKGTNTGTVTDEEGNYEITLADKQEELVFSFIGLQSTEMDASILRQLDVQMSNDVSQLSEVVVTGYGTRDDVDTEDGTATLELASPLGGRKAYKQYLEKSLRYPEVALENKIEGKVTIEFTVETTGALSEFKVLRGLGYGCDEEVIRLVKEGASWTPSKYGKELIESNVKIRLRFALPKK